MVFDFSSEACLVGRMLVWQSRRWVSGYYWLQHKCILCYQLWRACVLQFNSPLLFWTFWRDFIAYSKTDWYGISGTGSGVNHLEVVKFMEMLGTSRGFLACVLTVTYWVWLTSCISFVKSETRIGYIRDQYFLTWNWRLCVKREKWAIFRANQSWKWGHGFSHRCPTFSLECKSDGYITQ